MPRGVTEKTGKGIKFKDPSTRKLQRRVQYDQELNIKVIT